VGIADAPSRREIQAMKSPAQPQAKQQPRRADTEPARTLPTGASFLDNRPESIARTEMAEAINGSSYMVAQLQQLRRLFGSTAQLQTPAPSSSGNTNPGKAGRLKTLRATLNASPRVQGSAHFQSTHSPGVAQAAQLQKRSGEPSKERDRPANAADVVPDAPIQRVWMWSQIKSQKGQWKWVAPKDVGNKNEKPSFDGQVHGERYPPLVQVDLAAQAKQEKIREYTPLIPHLAGELDGDTGVKGGHVWKMMEKAWGDRLQLVTGTPSDTESWNCTWTIDDRTAKGSTMFPAAWDEAKLLKELTNSTVISGKLYVSGIGVKKAGDTFYPG
jgi:hypothetical protein